MRVPLVANGVRAVTERLTGMMPHDSRKNNNASPLAGATTAGTISRGHGHDALTATKRALALRVLFDPDAAGTLLDHYRARTAQIRAAAGKRAAALRRAPPYRAAAYLLAGFALYMLYRRRNRDRWCLLREHKERRAAVQTALDEAKSYEEFIALAHRMEALEEEHAARIRALERGGKHHRGHRVTQDREGIVAVQRRRRFIFRRRRRREQRVERRRVPWRRPALLRRGTHRGTAPAPSCAARVG
jgi:hypothetical protein